jgi:hypothetical protein
MPTTPSPYNYNRTRYKKVPKGAKGGGGCALTLLVLVAVPSVITIATSGLIVFNI